ncbi:MAG: class I SAM-dependent methyltransferase [Acidobacteria bacterium]|nr:class I SAM-dependent methyltransferase [Acidobacteriota bacterium]
MANAAPVRRVADIGCGAGQEMLPFIANGAFGCGLDYVPETGQVGRRLYEDEGLGDRVAFLRGSGDLLPFADSRFDVVVCRGAIMFMNNEQAIAEFARILRDGGQLFLMLGSASWGVWGSLRPFPIAVPRSGGGVGAGGGLGRRGGEADSIRSSLYCIC